MALSQPKTDGSWMRSSAPALRAFAKRLSKDNDVKVFLSNLPHQYFDEDRLHAFVISLEKEFDKCIEEVHGQIRDRYADAAFSGREIRHKICGYGG